MAPRPDRLAHRRHAGQGVPPLGRSDLFDQPGLDERRRSAFRRRLHGRAGLLRRAAAHQPPLRLRCHSAPLEPRTRLPHRRLLGPHPRRGAAQRKPQRPLPGAHGGDHRPPRRRRDSRGDHRRSDRGRPLHSLNRTDVLRQPAIPVRLRAVRRRAAGRHPALVDRQVRGRHRQLDMAPPHGRLLRIPHLCRPGKPPGPLLARQRALPSPPPLQDLDPRSRRGGFHHDLRIPGQHPAIRPFRRGGLCGGAFRSHEDRPAHPPAGNHRRGAGSRSRHAHPLRRQIRQHRQRMEEVAGRGAGTQAAGYDRKETGL